MSAPSFPKLPGDVKDYQYAPHLPSAFKQNFYIFPPLLRRSPFVVRHFRAPPARAPRSYFPLWTLAKRCCCYLSPCSRLSMDMSELPPLLLEPIVNLDSLFESHFSAACVSACSFRLCLFMVNITEFFAAKASSVYRRCRMIIRSSLAQTRFAVMPGAF